MGLTIKRVRRRSGEVNDLARVVIQFERLPFALLDFNAAERGDELRTQLEINYEVGGATCTWQAAGADPAGKPAVSLPGPYGNDVMVALGRAWNAVAPEPCDPGDEAHRTIRLPYRQLVELMGRTPGSTAYDALDETLQRLSSLVVRTNGAWREDGEWVDGWKAVTVFEAITHKRRRGAADRGVVTFVFTPTFTRALVTDSRLLNTRPHNALRLATSRRLYRLLDAERYQARHTGAGEIRLPLMQVRERMPLAETKPNKVRRTLDRAHAELVDAGYLAAAPEYAEERVAGRRHPVVSVTYVFAQNPAGKGGPDAVPAGGVEAAGVPSDIGQQAQLRALAGAPERPDRRSDLAWWVHEIERTLGDTGSSGFYKQLVEAFVAVGQVDALEFVLRGVARDGQGMPAKALGAAFTSRAKARVKELGIVLPAAGATPRAGSKRGAGIAAIGDLLPSSIDA